MLTLEHVSVTYDGVDALRAVDLSVADGEILSVLGPSGSGKSTMLRAIAGLVPDARGVVRWNGDDLTRVPPHRRGFGLMFQDHTLFPHRDVLANVGFGLRMQRHPRAVVDQRARVALARVGMAGFERRRVAELSGGEQQRVALARALAPEPRLLMLDEPFGALDRERREHLVGELRALFTSLDISVVFVTHDHDEAFALADRLLVMHGGVIVQAGDPIDVWARPSNAFVARFLGWNVTSAFGGPLVAIRPEDLTVSAPGEHGPTGVVVTRTFRRDHHLVTVRLDDRDADELRVAVPVDHPPPDIGDTVGVQIANGRGLRIDP
ncbi:MAG: ABC transporter ATP-binding protein [Acidimicrobiia bacterium]